MLPVFAPKGRIPPTARREERVALEFGPFRIDPERRTLLRGDSPVPLTPKAFDALVILVESPGRVLDKAELMRRLWPDAAVEESNLTQQIFTLRKAMGDGSEEAKAYIRTVPRRGYEFMAEVRRVEPAPPAAPTARRTAPRPPRWRWWRAAGVAAALVVLGAGASRFSGERLEASTLAVLPIENDPGAADSEYLADGLTEGLIRELGSVPALRVLGRATAFSYKGRATSPREAGRALAVDAVLTGRVAPKGNGVEVHAVLVRVADGRTLWNERYAVDVARLPDLQRAIREQVARRLARVDASPARARRPVDEEAYRLHLQGRFFWNKRTREGLQRSLAFFRQALRRDPDYAEAWSGLADAYNVLPEYSETTEAEAYPAAQHAAQRALSLDPALAEAHASLAFVSFWWGRDASRSLAEFEEALRLNPGYATAHHWYGNVLLSLDRVDEAVAHLEEAHKADPLSLIVGAERGSVLYHARRFDEAAEVLARTLEMDGRFTEARFWMARTRLAQGDHAGALEEARLARELYGRPGAMLAEMGVALARSGRSAEAREHLAELERLDRTVPVAYALSILYAGLGDTDRALRALDRAAVQRATDLSFLGSDPLFDPLRADPRFAALRARLREPREEAGASEAVAP
jgi:DNA-binding winged helix-turn-helix (wHTH) protein/TolB-like protein/Tfp pilus assembly protein PilF